MIHQLTHQRIQNTQNNVSFPTDTIHVPAYTKVTRETLDWINSENNHGYL